MATLEEKLCPVCFREAMEGGKCQNCGYVSDEASVGKNYLRSFSILNTKYLLGKSLGQGGFGITYLAKNNLAVPVFAENLRNPWAFLQGCCR